ncbi:MAG: hypothetical protein QM811_05065 [Pirellulales bacterium]
MRYLPPEPVDVVICEMLHVALIREKQLDVLHDFKTRYLAAFGPKLPRFIPDTTLLGVQPVQQDFRFLGYEATVPMFAPPGFRHDCRGLADPQVYGTISYEEELPEILEWSGNLPIHTAGTLNALQFQTKNFLAFDYAEERGVEWPMNQLVLPLDEPLTVRAGEDVRIAFRYRSGAPLESLQAALSVKRHTRALRRAA